MMGLKKAIARPLAAGAVLVAIAAHLYGCSEMPTRPESNGAEGAEAYARKQGAATPSALLTMSFASQNDPRWRCDQLGSCGGWTMGTCGTSSPGGCAVTSLWMLFNSFMCTVGTPGDLNRWLRSNQGYSDGCLINWARGADWDGAGGLKWVRTDAITSVSQLKSLVDQGYRIIARSKRFSMHWVAVRGYTGSGTSLNQFMYFDPWDTAPANRMLGDGLVDMGAGLRLYRL